MTSLRSALSLALVGGFLLSGCSKFRTSKDEAVQSDDENPYAEYVDDGKLFSCEVPSNWKPEIDSGMGTKNVSFFLLTYKHKGTKEKVLYSLTVFYYPHDNSKFRSPADYIHMNTTPFRDWSTPTFKDVTLKAGLTRRWTRTHPDVLEHETDAYAVIPVRNGFFVLTYTSPQELHERHLPDFEHLLSTFRPGPQA